ncbi:MAG: ATP-binding cassette domain-containing protein [Sphingopyxis sp.]|nr:ATP-binding cassette domain-containing protein [Sphingopyxis sp.]
MTTHLRVERVSQLVREGEEIRCVLSPVTATFTAGMFHVVSGGRGSGKSSLISILSLTVAAARGDIFFGDERLSALDPAGAQRWRARHIATIGPDSGFVPLLTFRENLKMVAALREQPEAIRQGEAMASLLGMAHLLDGLPAEFGSVDLRRMVIVQALCSEPLIVLADDPTRGMLDHDAVGVATLLRSYAHDRHAIVIGASEDRRMLAAADAVLRLTAP